MGVLGLEFSGVKAWRGERLILQALNFKVEPGEVVALLGNNGAGKSTAFLCASGLNPYEGDIRLDGHSLDNLPLYRRAQQGLAYLPQSPVGFPDLSVFDNLRAIAELRLSKNKRVQCVEKLLQAFELEPLKGQKASALSGGERRRLDLARLLIVEPRCLLLDEPFAALDGHSADIVCQEISKLAARGCGVLIAEHRLNRVLTVSSRVLLLHQGQVAFDGKSEGPELSKALKQWYSPLES